MKLAISNQEIKKQILAPPIPMQRPTPRAYTKADSLTFKLKSTPGQEDSSTYELTVPFFSTGTAEEVLLFFRGVNQVFTGQNITVAADKFAMMARLLMGDALSNWQQSLASRRGMTEVAFDYCKQQLLKHVFPPLALKKQKKYLRSGIRKPRGQTIRQFDARRIELINYLKEFPDWEDGKGFDPDEQKEMIEKAIPNSWYKNCILHDLLDPAKTTEDLIQHCEHLEFAESVTNDVGLIKNPSENKTNKRKRAESQTKQNAGKTGPKMDARKPEKGLNKNRNTGKWCTLHLTDSHDTGECKVLNSQAKKMRAAWDA